MAQTPTKIGILKTGASGDVVRTTTLLHLFPDAEVHWITSRLNRELLPQRRPGLHLHILDELTDTTVRSWRFDRFFSLDDEDRCADLATRVATERLSGIYRHPDGTLRYTDDSATWFDLGLRSRYGKTRADELKMERRDPVQAHLYRMADQRFSGQAYVLNEEMASRPESGRIGIEARAGARWPTKRWHRFEELAERLRGEGLEVEFFRQRSTLTEYARDIGRCEVVLSGDSLAMHLALGMDIPTVGLFTVTPPWEIFGYGRMIKLTAPLLKDAWFTTDYRPDVLAGIQLDAVYWAVREFIGSGL